MGFLIGLLPALFWGFTPVLVSKLGGKPINQQLGTSFGCAVLALAVLIIFRPAVCLISGLAWSVGQLCQFTSFSNQINGVAIGYTMAQLCLVIETILGLLFLHEKKTPAELKHSIAGAVFITLGCILVGLVGSV